MEVISNTDYQNIEKNIQIGIFDSGVGGLTVAKAIYEATNQLPLNTKISYFGDSKHIPYGNKSISNIIEYSINSVQFLLKQEIDIIVIACNTATALALPKLKKIFSVPILGVIEPSIKSALQSTKNLNIGIIGTYRTIKSNVYRDKLLAKESNCQIYQQACPSLVPVIEEGIKNKKILKDLLEEYLQKMTPFIDTLILGCTHYPLIKSSIKELYPHIKTVDSCQTTAKDICEQIKILKSLPSTNINSQLLKSNKKYQQEIEIYTNDFNEVFDTISQSLFPNTNVITTY